MSGPGDCAEAAAVLRRRPLEAAEIRRMFPVVVAYGPHAARIGVAHEVLDDLIVRVSLDATPWSIEPIPLAALRKPKRADTMREVGRRREALRVLADAEREGGAFNVLLRDGTEMTGVTIRLTRSGSFTANGGRVVAGEPREFVPPELAAFGPEPADRPLRPVPRPPARNKTVARGLQSRY